MNHDYRITAQVQPTSRWWDPRLAQLTDEAVLGWVQSQIGLPPGAQLTVQAATDLGPGIFRVAHNYRAEVDDEHVARAEAIDAAVRQTGLMGVDFVVEHIVDYTLQYALAGGGGGLAAGSKAQNLAPVLAIGGMVIGGLVGHATRRVEPAYRLQHNRWGQWQMWKLGDASGSPELS